MDDERAAFLLGMEWAAKAVLSLEVASTSYDPHNPDDVELGARRRGLTGRLAAKFRNGVAFVCGGIDEYDRLAAREAGGDE